MATLNAPVVPKFTLPPVVEPPKSTPPPPAAQVAVEERCVCHARALWVQPAQRLQRGCGGARARVESGALCARFASLLLSRSVAYAGLHAKSLAAARKGSISPHSDPPCVTDRMRPSGRTTS